MRPAGFDASLTPRDASHNAFACLNESPPSGPRFSSRRWIAVNSTFSPYCPNAGSFFLYVPQLQRAVYWEIARTYGLGDRFFAATSSASYPPHQFIVAGDLSITWPRSGGRVWHLSEDPGYSCFNATPGTHDLSVVGPNVFSIPLTIEGPDGGCYQRATYGDRLTEANATWRHYSTALPASKGIFPFDGFSNITAWYRQTINLPTAQFRGSTNVLDDASSGQLPNFVWVKPPCVKQSDHPGTGQGKHGPNWVGSVINAIGKGPNWDSTVIFVIWDDWGGYYDHVVPPAPDAQREELERGVRIPFLVISPFLAHPGGVVHTQGHPGSIMRFVDDLYGTKPLTAFDEGAPDLARWFDFTRAPRRFVPIAGATGKGNAWDDHWCDGASKIKVDS